MNLQSELGPVLIALFKGIVSRQEQENLWQVMLDLEAPVRDNLKILGLELVLSQDEGFAYLKNHSSEDGSPELPKLIQRRQLSYPVSLLLALLRRRLAEHDASNHEPRLILDTREVLDMAATFLPEGKTEARVLENLESHLKKVGELGFIRFLGQTTEKFEVKRILKAFIDAQWLKDFDQRLEEYKNFALDNDSSKPLPENDNPENDSNDEGVFVELGEDHHG